MSIVALEEHYVTPEVTAAWRSLDARWRDPVTAFSDDDDVGRRLRSLDGERLAIMDDAGVDTQVLSLTTPGLFTLDTADAVALQKPTNDVLAAAVARHPDRLQGFATLAPQDADAAAAELERAVQTLGFHGALVFSRVRDEPIDHPLRHPRRRLALRRRRAAAATDLRGCVRPLPGAAGDPGPLG